MDEVSGTSGGIGTSNQKAGYLGVSTPGQIAAELRQVRAEASKGLEVVYASEMEFARLERDAEVAEWKAFQSATGTVGDRQAVSKLASADLRFDAAIEKAKWNRARSKMRLLEQQQTSLQTEARIIELEWRG